MAFGRMLYYLKQQVENRRVNFRLPDNRDPEPNLDNDLRLDKMHSRIHLGQSPKHLGTAPTVRTHVVDDPFDGLEVQEGDGTHSDCSDSACE
jgi:hypothetical protein